MESFYRPLICWDPQSKSWARFSPTYERLKPRIGLAMQGTWKVPRPLVWVLLGGNQSWQKTPKEYKPAMCSRILLHPQKDRPSVGSSSACLPVKKAHWWSRMPCPGSVKIILFYPTLHRENRLRNGIRHSSYTFPQDPLCSDCLLTCFPNWIANFKGARAMLVLFIP